MQFYHRKVRFSSDAGKASQASGGNLRNNVCGGTLFAESYAPDDVIGKLAHWKHNATGDSSLVNQGIFSEDHAIHQEYLLTRFHGRDFSRNLRKSNFLIGYPKKKYNENGSALLIVLIICLSLMIVVGAVLTVSTNSLSQSSDYTFHSEVSLASQAGLSAAVSAINSALPSGPASYPCSLSSELSNGNTSTVYSVTVTYYAGSTQEACSGGGIGVMSSTLGPQTNPPTNATILSVGDMTSKAAAAKNNQVEMEENVVITSGQSAVPNEAILTEAPLVLNNQDNIAGGPGVGPADVSTPYFTCSATTTVQGSVITGTSGAQILAPCQVTGNLQSDGPVYISGVVAGNTTAWLKGAQPGSSGITINNGGYAGGNVTSYGAGISIGQAAVRPIGASGTSIDAYDGNLSLEYANDVAKGVSYNATGTVTVNFDTSKGTLGASTGIPTFPPPFPKAAPMPVTGNQNVTENIINCSQFTSLFAQDVANFARFYPGNNTLTINASMCQNVTVSESILFQENVNLYVGSLDIGGTSGFGQACLYTADTESTCNAYLGWQQRFPSGPQSAPYYAFRVFDGVGFSSGQSCGAFGSTNANVDITGSGAAIIASDIHLFIYTPGSVSLGNSVNITGQIYACSGLKQGSGGIAITYYPTSSLLEGIQGPPSISVVNEYLLKG